MSDAIAQYEAKAEAFYAFYRDTGVMAPGKDVSAVMGEYDADELRHKLWAVWCRLTAERDAAVQRAERAEGVLENIRSDAQTTLDQYDKNGPTWTSRESGMEYYDASYVIEGARDRIAAIDTALTRATAHTTEETT